MLDNGADPAPRLNTLLQTLEKEGFGSNCFNNRELSWLEFNARVLAEAMDQQMPLLERLKFIGIFSSNMDEFFMIRVAGVKHQISAAVEVVGADGLKPLDALEAISARAHELVATQHACLRDDITPKLAMAGIRVLSESRLSSEQRKFLDEYFRGDVLPLMTPLAHDPGHPFPHLANKTLCLVVQLVPRESSSIPYSNTVFLHIPGNLLPRFVRLPSAPGTYEFFLMEELVRMHLPDICHGYEVKNCAAIRLTRDSDVLIEEDRAADLLTTIEMGLRGRRKGAAVRLQYQSSLPESTLQTLIEELDLKETDLYPTEDMIAYADFFQLYSMLELPHLKDPPFTSQHSPAFLHADHVFAAIRDGDILLHHPYESFDPVVTFVRQAADDPKVLAIKMTLYRVGKNSPIAEDLVRAAQNNKQVVVLMELKARFDEEANILWAKKLEDAGAHVIYGLVGFKTHCKCSLIIRREGTLIRRYVHLGTGNYNDKTSRLYCDLGLFTCNEKIADDAAQLFNIITGYSRPPQFNHLEIAPTGLRKKLVSLIRRESENAQKGLPARMIIKLNNLQDPELIAELYRAGRAGVKIDLIIRSVCAIRPGVPGVSENIRAISILDRFLEHARLLYFHNNGNPEYYMASADWMQRNLDRRIELLFPVLDRTLHQQLQNLLELQLADNVKARVLNPDCTFAGLNPGAAGIKIRSQECLLKASLGLTAKGRWGPFPEGVTSGKPQATLVIPPRNRRKAESGRLSKSKEHGKTSNQPPEHPETGTGV